MTWAFLDDHVDEEEKLLEVGGEAAWYWACGLAFCRRSEKMGKRRAFIPAGKALILFPTKRPAELVKKLVVARLWLATDGGYVVNGYDKVYGAAPKSESPVSQVAAAAPSPRSEAAKKAANVRWGKATAHANASATHMRSASPQDAERIGDAFENDANRIASGTDTGSYTDTGVILEDLPKDQNQSGKSEASDARALACAEDAPVGAEGMHPPMRAGDAQREPGKPPRPRPDLLFRKIPAGEYSPTDEHRAYAAEIGIDADEFEEVLIELRDKLSPQRGNLPPAGHDLPWWDKNLVAFLDARARVKAKPRGAPGPASTNRNKRQPDCGVDGFSFASEPILDGSTGQ